MEISQYQHLNAAAYELQKEGVGSSLYCMLYVDKQLALYQSNPSTNHICRGHSSSRLGCRVILARF